MHRIATSVLLLSALLGGSFVTASAARGEEAWERSFVQAREQQDEELRKVVVGAKGDMKAIEASIGRIVDRFRQGMRTQGSALSHYLYGRVLFKQSESEGHQDKNKKDEAIREMQAAKSRGAGWFATYALAYIHLTTGDLDTGEAFVSELMRTEGGRPEVQGLYARVLMARGRWPELKTLAEKLILQNAGNLGARDLLATAYMGLKDWPRAQATYESMILRAPKDVQLRLRLIDCLVSQKKFDTAKKECLALITASPKDVRLRLVYTDILVEGGDLAGATVVMKQVLDAYPKDIGIMGRLSELYLRNKQPAEAERILLQALALCKAGDEDGKALLPFVLRNLAFATYEQERYESVVLYLEELARLGDLAPHLLEMQARSYAKLERKDDLLRTLKKLLKLLEGRPQEAKQIQDMIAAIEKGEKPAPDESLWTRDNLVELVERCLHPDVKVRREALRQYFDLDLPFVDPVVYQRHDPRIEPDPECRLIVVQVLGRFRVSDAHPEIVRIASRYVGYALEDPDQEVRMMAAQELGRIGAPAGILYLMPYLEHMQLDTSGLTTSSRVALEKEYNAARATLAALTGRQDIEPGAPNWVGIDATPAHRDAWLAWYDGAAAVPARMRALADLDQDENAGPRWPLRYLLTDLMKQPRSDGRTTPTQIWVRTYQLLRRHVLLVKQTDAAAFAKDPWWPTFPIYEDEDLSEERIPTYRQALKDWWVAAPKPPRGDGR